MQRWKGKKFQQTVECRIYAKLGQSMMLNLVISQILEGFPDQYLLQENVFQGF
jgi:hypothetical protein